MANGNVIRPDLLPPIQTPASEDSGRCSHWVTFRWPGLFLKAMDWQRRSRRAGRLYQNHPRVCSARQARWHGNGALQSRHLPRSLTCRSSSARATISNPVMSRGNRSASARHRPAADAVTPAFAAARPDSITPFTSHCGGPAWQLPGMDRYLLMSGGRSQEKAPVRSGSSSAAATGTSHEIPATAGGRHDARLSARRPASQHGVWPGCPSGVYGYLAMVAACRSWRTVPAETVTSSR
jgi:hypothetical protein